MTTPPDDLCKLVERARSVACTKTILGSDCSHPACYTVKECATALERLLAENEALREDLNFIEAHWMGPLFSFDERVHEKHQRKTLRAAIAAARREEKP